jgi:predicted nucleic acid-binding protein
LLFGLQHFTPDVNHSAVQKSYRFILVKGSNRFKKMATCAIDISRRHQVSYWDGAILAAAERLEAKVVYSEDMSHQQMYCSVQVINPFV